MKYGTYKDAFSMIKQAAIGYNDYLNFANNPINYQEQPAYNVNSMQDWLERSKKVGNQIAGTLPQNPYSVTSSTIPYLPGDISYSRRVTGNP